MDIQNQPDKEVEDRMRRLFAHMYITNSRYHFVFSPQKPSRHILDVSLASVSHKRKKANQKLTYMKYLKDNKTVILGYDKTSERGDINFIDSSQPKISDFYYNKLQGGLGGITCFEDGRFVLVADKKGVFAYVDLAKGPNIDDIKSNSVQTSFQGTLDICLAPFQMKVVCGMSDNRCLLLDIGKNRGPPVQTKQFRRHVYGVNSVNWHPFKSLILSSSLDIHDTIKLWDPHSDQVVQQINLHNKATITCSQFHPQGHTYFSIGKDNVVYEHQIRLRGYLNKFKLQFEPTALQVMRNGNIVISDGNGGLSWYDKQGVFIKRLQGNSGVVTMASDLSRNILAVGRQRQHTFQFYTHQEGLQIDLP